MEILEIELLTNDIEATIGFYTKILGLQIISRNKHWVSFAAGATKLTFRFLKKEKPVYHFAFDIPNNQLIDVFAWVESRTKILEVIPPDKIADFHNWNAKSFYFYDNNGNILECIARFNLENKSEKPFDSTSIVSISEIGFVAKNVSKFCDELVYKYGLPVFSLQPKLDKFIVLGTETGLFILAKEGKDWYPTKIKAKSFWSKVVFSINGKTQEIEVID